MASEKSSKEDTFNYFKGVTVTQEISFNFELVLLRPEKDSVPPATLSKKEQENLTHRNSTIKEATSLVRAVCQAGLSMSDEEHGLSRVSSGQL